MSRQWIVAQIAARQHYAIPRCLHARGRLERLYTDIWTRRGRSVLAAMPGKFRALAGRRHDAIPDERVTSFNFGMIARIVAAYRCKTIEDSYLDFAHTGEWFSRKMAADLARRDLHGDRHAALLFTTCALEAVQHLKSRGVRCVVDQPDPARVEEQIVQDEIAKFPGWQKQPGRIPDAYYERLSKEWHAADAVLVNSAWSKQALVQQGVDAAKVKIVPQAYEGPDPVGREPRNRDMPFNVLWLGQVILRKGIPYLFEAARLLQGENIRFSVVGWLGIAETAARSAPPNVHLMGSVPRSETENWYRSADVFALPTLSDGFATTQLEAMAYGVPVITTSRCGEVVTDGVDGLVIPPMDANALADAILKLYQDRDQLAAMSAAATQTVGRFTLDRYAAGIESTLA